MGGIFKGWLGKKDGVAALEFALVGFPFVLMIIGTIEMALMFTTQSVLHEAAFTASRLIRTGQVQESGAGAQSMFENAVCDFAQTLIPCAQIQYQVQKVPSFADAANTPPQFDKDGKLLNTGFNPGAQNDIVLVRVSYNYPITTPMMQPLLSNNGSKRTLYSTIVLQTEPYKDD